MGLADICRVLDIATEEHAFFPAAHNTFSGVIHIGKHKPSLNQIEEKRAGKRASQRRALAALAEDPQSVLSSCVWLPVMVSGALMPPLGSSGTTHCSAQT